MMKALQKGENMVTSSTVTMAVSVAGQKKKKKIPSIEKITGSNNTFIQHI